MKTLTHSHFITEEQRNMITNNDYLRSEENDFAIKFEKNTECDPFNGEMVTTILMTASLDAMGWITVGEIFNKTSKSKEF